MLLPSRVRLSVNVTLTEHVCAENGAARLHGMFEVYLASEVGRYYRKKCAEEREPELSGLELFDHFYGPFGAG